MRSIIHVDMDEFFAAVEKLDNPALRGKPLLVGGDPKGRGVVATASYEARVYGCRSAMPMAKAVRQCPQAIIIHPRFERYSAISRQIFDIFEQFTPLVEPLSIDEAFLDITASLKLFGDAVAIAREIKNRIQREVGLTASVGVAGNKFLAKLASDLKKPDGLVVIESDQVHAILDPLPVTKIWGIGPAAAKQLERLNVGTIGQLRRVSPELLARTIGRLSAELYLQLANGLDDRPVETEGQAKSIGQEETFAQDVSDLEQLRQVLLSQAQEVARRLRAHGLKARTVTLKLRYGDFTTISRSHTLEEATDVTAELWQVAKAILESWAQRSFRPMRLLGLSASNLCAHSDHQLSLFGPETSQKQQRLDEALDGINHRFGRGAIQRGKAKDKP